MPKGKMIATNQFQAMFMHYPRQQQCAIDVLEQMESYSKFKACICFYLMVNIQGVLVY